jgi:two-component system chemotaxis response regulator CheB
VPRGVTRVVVVDDSRIAQERLEDILENGRDIRVVRKLGSLLDVVTAREVACGDVVVLDMWMPGRSGLSALTDVAASAPVVVVSEAPIDSDIAREATARGAFAYVSKRELGTSEGAERLRRVVREAAHKQKSAEAQHPFVLIAGSTGAHRALGRMAPSLVALEARVVIVQHLAEGSDDVFVQWLAGFGVSARLAVNGQMLELGVATIAPAGQQMTIEAPGRVRLRASAGELHAPSADIVFSSAAFAGARATAIVLSGLGRDGARGAADIAKSGGRVLVQAPDDDCVARSMPQAVLETTPDARALSPDALAREIGRVARR